MNRKEHTKKSVEIKILRVVPTLKAWGVNQRRRNMICSMSAFASGPVQPMVTSVDASGAGVDQQLRYGDQLVSPNAEEGMPGYGV